MLSWSKQTFICNLIRSTSWKIPPEHCFASLLARCPTCFFFFFLLLLPQSCPPHLRKHRTSGGKNGEKLSASSSLTSRAFMCLVLSIPQGGGGGGIMRIFEMPCALRNCYARSGLLSSLLVCVFRRWGPSWRMSGYRKNKRWWDYYYYYRLLLLDSPRIITQMRDPGNSSHTSGCGPTTERTSLLVSQPPPPMSIPLIRHLCRELFSPLLGISLTVTFFSHFNS